MNCEINREDWAPFLTTLNARRYEWQTTVEVLDPEAGDQILTDRLPLNGITVETKGGCTSVGVSVGDALASHQTHTIINPTRIAFLAASDAYEDVLDIEEEDGTKTLIRFAEPIGLPNGYFSCSDMLS